MKALTVRDINATLVKKQEQRAERFSKILESCYKKIERAVSINSTFIFFEVPELIFGFPLYNVNECIMYLKNSLEGSGFLCKYFFPNIIYVSWNAKEIEEHKQQAELQKMTHINKLLGNTTEQKVINAPSQQSGRGRSKRTTGTAASTKRLTLNLE